MSQDSEQGRLLLVEDEEKIAHVLKLELEHEGYRVDVVGDGRLGLSKATMETWDLLLLDVMLPGVDGLTICKAAREKHPKTPIILLTARGEVDDRVLGLDSGADDYIVKPFESEELFARIRAVLRRGEASKDRREDVLQIGDLVLNLNTREVQRQGQNIELRKREYELLRFLMENSPWVMTREVIMEKVWGFDYLGSSNIIDVYVRYLRSKVDDPFPTKLIHSVRGVGYVLKVES